jgi:hypothetical protein
MNPSLSDANNVNIGIKEDINEKMNSRSLNMNDLTNQKRTLMRYKNQIDESPLVGTDSEGFTKEGVLADINTNLDRINNLLESQLRSDQRLGGKKRKLHKTKRQIKRKKGTKKRCGKRKYCRK